MGNLPVRWTLDANVILRYLLGDDKRLSARARNIMLAIEAGQLEAECDPVTLAEVVFVMSSVYGVDNDSIGEALGSLLQAEGIVMAGKPRYLKALELLRAGVRHYGDACACAAALEQSEGRLFSFDRKLSAVPGIARRETPE